MISIVSNILLLESFHIEILFGDKLITGQEAQLFVHTMCEWRMILTQQCATVTSFRPNGFTAFGAGTNPWHSTGGFVGGESANWHLAQKAHHVFLPNLSTPSEWFLVLLPFQLMDDPRAFWMHLKHCNGKSSVFL